MGPKNDLVIYGCGGHGREVLDIALSRGYSVAGFLSDWAHEKGREVRPNLSVLGDYTLLGKTNPMDVVVAIGSGRARKSVSEKVASVLRGAFPVLVHSSSSLGGEIDLGPGSVIFPGARLTFSIKVGAHGVVHANAIVTHDCVLGAFSTLGPGATLCGQVQVGEGALIGAGATVIPGISIGAWAIVGAGAVVIRDVPPGEVVVGVPARPQK